MLGISISRNWLPGEVSSGLGSSRIDLLRDSKLNDFGFDFRTRLALVDEAGESAMGSAETSDFAGVPTGRRVRDRSVLSVREIIFSF